MTANHEADQAARSHNGDPPMTNDYDRRLSKLSISVAEVTRDVGNLTASVDRMSIGIQTITQTMQNNSKPQWQTMAAWAGVLLLVIGYFVADGRAGNARILDYCKERSHHMEAEWTNRHNRLDAWNGRQEVKREEIEKQISRLETLTEIHQKRHERNPEK